MSTPLPSKIYTGVGSRTTPNDVLKRMEALARQLANRGWLLRSGHADGADRAFERGCDASYGRKEIFLPWYKFNGSDSRFNYPSNEAIKIAEAMIDNWQYLRRPVKLLHARNVHQVLGEHLTTPTHLVICWTPGGEPVGGTRTAILLAQGMEIPIINLATQPNWDIEDIPMSAMEATG